MRRATRAPLSTDSSFIPFDAVIPVGMSPTAHLRAAVLAALLLAACSDSTGPEARFAAPEDIEAVATSAVSVRVVFTLVDGAESYRIERAVGDGPFTEVATRTTFYYDDTGLLPATTYRYRVAAVRGSDVTPPSAVAEAETQAAGSREAVLVGPIATNRTLAADSQYILRRVAKVIPGATLIIQPGTTILGDVDAPPSLLLVGRGGRIVADGTADRPIIFTSSRPFGERLPGDWGGIAIVGNATTNLSQPAETEAPPPYGEPYTGGTNDDDDSGTLRYVRIEFAGGPTVAGRLQNALTMLAVGRGTTIEYVQVIAALNDSFKWFGGTVDGRYLLSYEVGDDHFDASQGYRGRNQFLVALRTRRIEPSPSAAQPPGNALAFELDGCEPDFPPCAASRRPANAPVFANFSIVDTRPDFSQGWSGGAQFRDESGGFLVNGAIVNVRAYAVSILDDGSNGMRQRDSLVISNLLLANPDNFAPDHAARPNWANRNLEESSLSFSQLFVGMPASPDPAGDPRINWTPASDSPLASAGLTSFTGTLAERAGTFVVPTSYRGAAAPAGPAWWADWTVYYVR
jgi:hypothetical protein